MIIIGVTGTNGKTTSVNMVTHILKSSNKKVGMASTVNFQINDKSWTNETHKTTLGRFRLQKLLREMVSQNCEYAVLEVSSHALSQGRLIGIPFDVACFLNLSREHLDYHKTMEQYRLEKGKLFKALTSHKPKTIKGREIPRISIINLDEEAASYFLSFPADEYCGFTVNEENIRKDERTEIVYGKNIKTSPTFITFDLIHNNFKIPLKINLLGKFNAENALAASTVCLALGISPEIIKLSLEQFENVPGRLEDLNLGQDFKVLIDYAVTPASFEKVFNELKEVTEGNLISVFGACGDRDKGKRPNLGQIAGKLTDKVIITNEEPYTEKPEDIIDAIGKGVEQTNKEEGRNFWKILDRREAIQFAVNEAKPGDTVVITGMGDQTSMMIGNKMVPWSDREEAKKAVEMRLNA